MCGYGGKSIFNTAQERSTFSNKFSLHPLIFFARKGDAGIEKNRADFSARSHRFSLRPDKQGAN
jgi:hypothetical protein